MPYPQTLLSDLRARATELGIAALGVVRPEPSSHGAALARWLEAGLHAEMAWMARPDAVARRADPRATFPEAHSIVVVAHPYGARDPDGIPDDPALGVVARYARGRDYHRVLDGKLRALARWLDGVVDGGVRSRAYVDTGPILERELAERAGLGWFGRNTMLIHPRRGSYTLLGALLVDAELPTTDDEVVGDHCGTCTACLDGCPTGALLGRDATGAPRLDARRCISYWTIETAAPIPEPVRIGMGNRVFGCDICQEVCPWNRFADATGDPAYAARGPGELPDGVQPLPGESAVSHPGTEAPHLVDLFALSEGEWEAWSRASPLRRAGWVGFRRSVAVALGNWLASVPPEAPRRAEAIAALTDALSDAAPVVRDHAAWALERCGDASDAGPRGPV